MKKVLIVGTVPYNRNTSSRAFDAYFNGWERENLAQIFSHPKTPTKGHCSRFYQITDKRMLQRYFSRKVQVERTFFHDELEDDWKDRDQEVGSGIFKKLYSMGTRKSPFIYLARGVLWKKRYWCTETLNRWLDDFKPDCVFLSFSDDYFIPRIALYVAERFDIPIVSSIGDDYYFNYKFSLSPLYHLYKRSYRKLIRKVFAHGGSAIYISDKIRDKYNAEFGLNGETVYLTSEVERRPFKPIDQEKLVISYFGNIGLGRNESLSDIGDALREISAEYQINVYSAQNDPKETKILEENPGVHFGGSISYQQVVEKTAESDVLVIVEGFKEADVNITRYSLSTKAADSLASGAQILVYGSPECGVIEYMQSTDSAMVCTDRAELTACIRKLITDEALQKAYYDQAIKITKQNHTLESSTRVFRGVVERATEEYGKKN